VPIVDEQDHLVGMITDRDIAIGAALKSTIVANNRR
jgi:CBS domain-containing protein